MGGGVAGAVLATRLARRGHEVVVLERSPAWIWRAGGVFSSPAAMTALRRAGFDDEMLANVARPIPAMRVETSAGTTFRLTYGTESGGEPAVGFDRARLDPLLLECAATFPAPMSGAAAPSPPLICRRVLTPRSRRAHPPAARVDDRRRRRTRILSWLDPPASTARSGSGLGLV